MHLAPFSQSITFEPEKEKKMQQEFFVYGVYFPAIAAGIAQPQNLQIQADSSFAWLKGTFQADIAGAAQTDSSRVIPKITLMITDNGSGRNLMNIAIPVTSLFGTGEIPFILPQARNFSANSNITFTASNLEPVNTYNLRLSLIGYKLYP
jgi:hypothetical protein